METGMTVPALKNNIGLIDPAVLADQEQSTNEQVFARLNTEQADVDRAVQFLEQALHSAVVRQRVIQAAINELNAPADAVPSAPPLR